MPVSDVLTAPGPLERAKDDVGLVGVDEAGMDDDQRLSWYIGLHRTLSGFEAACKLLSEKIGELEPRVIEKFQELGQQKITRHGMTVYLRQEIWPGYQPAPIPEGLDVASDEYKRAKASADAAGKAALLEALKGHDDTSFLVQENFNYQTLRSWLLKDCEKDAMGMPVIPEHLQGKLKITEKYRAPVIKG